MLTFINKNNIINLSNEREVILIMEEKRNYVIYTNIDNEIERIILMTAEQAKAIRWFMDTWDIDGTVELAENYVGEEI